MSNRRESIRSVEALHTWIRENLGLNIPRTAATQGSAAPFAYICHAFFEGRVPGKAPASPDCIVWANRGGGKTFLGAVATALDLVFKPGIQVRILAGSLEQASRMHEHLRAMFDRPKLKDRVCGRITDRRITLKNSSRVELLAQSQASVRGVRPHRLRCDEVELFDPEVWEAAQLTTRSSAGIRASIECLSTMHRPFGLMARLIAEGTSRTVFKWNLVDVLEECAGRECRSVGGDCPLVKECSGAAKQRAGDGGHMTIADAITLKSRVSLPIWEAEMLCMRPSRADTVLPEFDRSRHVVSELPWEVQGPAPELWLGGMDFGFRSPTVFVRAALQRGEGGDRLYIVEERYGAGVVMGEHIQAILRSPLPRPAWIGADPAGHARHEHTGQSNIQLLRGAGLSVRARGSSIAQGIEAIRARLAPADGGPPRLVVHERCVKLIESLERYHYDPERPFSEEPVKDGPDHAVDALRYLVINLDRAFQASASAYA